MSILTKFLPFFSENSGFAGAVVQVVQKLGMVGIDCGHLVPPGDCFCRMGFAG
ncbi:MAG: hypothetical protein WCN98_06265 [Verrucomicrobiaceae bacterium]